jgi:hypothetical protein
VVFLGANLIS